MARSRHNTVNNSACKAYVYIMLSNSACLKALASSEFLLTLKIPFPLKSPFLPSRTPPPGFNTFPVQLPPTRQAVTIPRPFPWPLQFPPSPRLSQSRPSTSPWLSQPPSTFRPPTAPPFFLYFAYFLLPWRRSLSCLETLILM